MSENFVRELLESQNINETETKYLATFEKRAMNLYSHKRAVAKIISTLSGLVKKDENVAHLKDKAIKEIDELITELQEDYYVLFNNEDKNGYANSPQFLNTMSVQKHQLIEQEIREAQEQFVALKELHGDAAKLLLSKVGQLLKIEEQEFKLEDVVDKTVDLFVTLLNQMNSLLNNGLSLMKEIKEGLGSSASFKEKQVDSWKDSLDEFYKKLQHNVLQEKRYVQDIISIYKEERWTSRRVLALVQKVEASKKNTFSNIVGQARAIIGIQPLGSTLVRELKEDIKRDMETFPATYDLGEYIEKIERTLSNPRSPVYVPEIRGILLAAQRVRRDVERKDADSNDEANKLLHEDDLTKLPNEREIRRIGAQMLEMTNIRDRRKDSPVIPISVLYMDLDNFKPYNDIYGHNVGDLMLGVVGNAIRRSIRTEKGKNDVLGGRLHGDEFCAILYNSTKKDAAKVAERIRKTVINDTYIEGRKIQKERKNKPVLEAVGVTTGISTYPEDFPDANIDDPDRLFDSMLQLADKRLNAAKAREKGSIGVAV